MKEQYYLKQIKNNNKEELAKINDVLCNWLSNYKELNKTEIEQILALQDEDGGFKITSKKIIGKDEEYAYEMPTYYCALILVNLKLDGSFDIDVNVINKALDYSYDALYTKYQEIIAQHKVDVMILFGANRINEYLDKYYSNSKFKIFINRVIEKYSVFITKDDSDDPVLTKMKRAVVLLDNESAYYIAYGSNLNRSRMQQRCENAVPMEAQILPGYKLRFALYLTIDKKKHSKTPIVIWKISKEDEKKLDRYEGYPTVYRKEYINLNVMGENKKCLVYIMNDIEDRQGEAPSDTYYDICMKGYKDFGLDKSYLIRAHKECF